MERVYDRTNQNWVFPPDMDEIVCVFVVFGEGEEYWTPLRDYRANPPAGSYILKERKRI